MFAGIYLGGIKHNQFKELIIFPKLFILTWPKRQTCQERTLNYDMKVKQDLIFRASQQ